MTETGFTVALKNGLKPLCAICDGVVYTDQPSPFMFWTTIDDTLYYFHTECGLSKMEDDYRKDFAEEVLGDFE